LRLTNQLTEKFDLAKDVFEQMNVELSAVMRRFTTQGVMNFVQPFVLPLAYCTSANSFRGNYTFVNLEIVEIVEISIVYLINGFFCCGNYSRMETICRNTVNEFS
jgi:hypothetical protein